MTQGARAAVRFSAAGLEAKPTVCQSLARNEQHTKGRSKNRVRDTVKFVRLLLNIDYFIEERRDFFKSLFASYELLSVFFVTCLFKIKYRFLLNFP